VHLTLTAEGRKKLTKHRSLTTVLRVNFRADDGASVRSTADLKVMRAAHRANSHKKRGGK